MAEMNHNLTLYLTQEETSFVGCTIPDRFVVGYGLDLAQRYRELPDIYTVDEPPER